MPTLKITAKNNIETINKLTLGNSGSIITTKNSNRTIINFEILEVII
jgi:hypothetical protein